MARVLRGRLRRRAFDEAATCLGNAMDGIELGDDLNEHEEEAVREFIRETIVDQLRKQAIDPKGVDRG